MNTQYKQKGFTIIEVVLVLAIAGLIFLMVFIALPALQASQRDTARKNDASIVSTGVVNYYSNNGGSFPLAANFDKASLTGLSSNTKTVSVVGSAPATVATGTVYVQNNATCGASNHNKPVINSGTGFVVYTYLETGGGTVYCSHATY